MGRLSAGEAAPALANFQLTLVRPFGLAESQAGVSMPRRRWSESAGRLDVAQGMGNVDTLLAASRVIDSVNLRIGKWLSWLVLVVVLISAANATVRKLFDTSSNAWLELQWVLFGVIFLLCSPWTLLSNEHIRIDILNAMFPARLRNAIDLIGHALFLLPLTLIMIVTAYPFFRASWAINEQSMNAGGLPVWPAKGMILIGFFLLFLQGLSELIKRVAVIRGAIPDPHTSGSGIQAAAEAERLLTGLKSEPR
jgi:TRAP-type mannitol/chloroaromatic compound transport system permease small subunit